MRIVKCYGNVRRGSMHRLHVYRDWVDEQTYTISLFWGTRWDDPVWEVGVDIKINRGKQ